MSLSIDLSIEVEAPIERAWEAVGTQEGLRNWYSPNIEFEARLGSWVEFGGAHDERPYRFGGKIVAFEPPRLVTWEWDWVPSRWPEPTLLTMELTPLGDERTRVDLHHHGFERLPQEIREQTYQSFHAGWTDPRYSSELRDLKAYLEGAAVPA